MKQFWKLLDAFRSVGLMEAFLGIVMLNEVMVAVTAQALGLMTVGEGIAGMQQQPSGVVDGKRAM